MIIIPADISLLDRFEEAEQTPQKESYLNLIDHIRKYLVQSNIMRDYDFL
jgi:hypothetical protein